MHAARGRRDGAELTLFYLFVLFFRERVSVPGDATSSPVEVMSRGLSGAVFIVESEKMEGSDLMIK